MGDDRVHDAIADLQFWSLLLFERSFDTLLAIQSAISKSGTGNKT